ncbi:hypothetical protein FNF27_07461 [Cafeteria roenbergensis]|uniref:Uncharacterized protein n=1 Tax=Cafeteria roenbergensis TaxID=33653 RepID=A0A5A8DMU6_CAFRO|nr:hypothetical protein FNF31_07432 [Cafeteria roenbergensis]KAA0161031.1 hypothetical protein FNF28_05237 [Cafeteria roenbergensis]KAA0166722.1 hypothetical protein FNF27_07461 [Cafeteria roenbergensis]
MAQTPVRALPVFLASATAVSVFLFAVRPRIAQRQLEAVRAAETVEEIVIAPSQSNPMKASIAAEVANPKRRFLYPAASFSEMSGGRNEGVNDPRFRR